MHSLSGMKNGITRRIPDFWNVLDFGNRNGSRPATSFGIRLRKACFAGILALHWAQRCARSAFMERLRRGMQSPRIAASALGGLCGLSIAIMLFTADFGGEASGRGEASGKAAASKAVASVDGQNGLRTEMAIATGSAVLNPESPIPELRMTSFSETWQRIKRPIAMFSLDMPDNDGMILEHKIAARGKHARQEILTWTVREGRKAARQHVHVIVERYEQGVPTFRPLYADLAARASEQGFSIERMKAPAEIATKFGATEIADAALSNGQSNWGCLMFRRNDSIGFVLAGWYCGTPERPADRVSLICFLDRLDLVGAGQDIAVKRLFAQAERNRASCGAARQSGRRLTWLDHEAPMPALKLSAKR
jgi:hypothetical protein